MKENERYLEELNQNLKKTLADQNQNPHLTVNHIKNMMDDLRLAAERFTKAENKQRETADVARETKSLETSGPLVAVEDPPSGDRRPKTPDTVSTGFLTPTLQQENEKYSKIYPSLSPTPSQLVAIPGGREFPVRPVNTIFAPKRVANMELQMKSTLSKLNKINQYKKGRILTLERIESNIKENMKRL